MKYFPRPRRGLSRPFYLLLLLGTLALPSPGAPLCDNGECQALISQTTYFGRKAFKITDGRSEAVVVPEIGRIMRFGLVGGPNLLWNAPTPKGQNIIGWSNYGGDKSWLGPQSYWPLWNQAKGWPPDKALDGSPHEAEVLTGGKLRMTSPLSAGTGIRITREMYFDDKGNFVIEQTARKWRGEPVRASIWSNSQVVPGDAIFVPLEANSPYKKNFHWLTVPKGVPDLQAVTSTLLRFKPSEVANFKIGVDAPVSAIASVRDQVAFVQRAGKPKGQYPDGADGAGFPVEFFHTRTRTANYVELELLSPLMDFRLASRWRHTVRWSIHPLPSADVDAPETLRAIDGLLRGEEVEPEVKAE